LERPAVRTRVHSSQARFCFGSRARILDHARWLDRVELLAIRAIAAILVLDTAILASTFPAFLPEWMSQLWPRISRKPHAYCVTLELLAMAMPVFFWIISLLLRRRSTSLRVIRDHDSEADRVEFCRPLIAGGVVGRPNALVRNKNGGSSIVAAAEAFL
jgi:hypothetical protein